MSKTIVIVGGVAGGASCAARLRRNDEHARIIVLERGPHVSFANCGLPYYVSGIIANEEDLLLATPEFFKARFNIDVRTGHNVTGIDRTNKTVQITRMDGGQEQLSYDHLVLSPGALPLIPQLPGIDLPGIFSLRTVPDSNQIKQWVKRHDVRHAVVVGGGFIGLEVTENLHHLEIGVTLIQRDPQIMTTIDPEMVQPMTKAVRAAGIDLRLNTEVSRIDRDATPSGTGPLRVTLSNGQQLLTDMLILAIGVRPDSALAQSCGLEVSPRGHIVVDSRMQTSDPDIFAVGDVVEVSCAITGKSTALPLAGPANRQGRLVADIITGKRRGFRGVQGTAICGAFGLTLASTGLNERALRGHKIPYETIYIHPRNHVGYYPGAKTINMKLLYETSNGRVLGAQAIGEDGVERRIDVIAMAIQMGATVFDLEEAELCYAPQYGAAKDPVNLAGMVAANAMRGDLPITHWNEIGCQTALVLDVRTAGELQQDPMPCGKHIPIDELRARLGELSKDTPIQVVCGVGIRAYNAICMLRQEGFQASLLSGGVSTWMHLDTSPGNN
jgi:NADPH-dependent 2,4-dienoyl-CoA reductase/sulfur reductase-like enzyme/rhodanese-related sulfurtransferase